MREFHALFFSIYIAAYQIPHYYFLDGAISNNWMLALQTTAIRKGPLLNYGLGFHVVVVSRAHSHFIAFKYIIDWPANCIFTSKLFIFKWLLLSAVYAKWKLFRTKCEEWGGENVLNYSCNCTFLRRVYLAVKFFTSRRCAHAWPGPQEKYMQLDISF